MTKVNFPSVTLCNEHGLDSGEYVRNVFNNLAFVGEKGSNLRGEFKPILDDLTVDMGYKYVTHGGMLQRFMEEWMRYIFFWLKGIGSWRTKRLSLNLTLFTERFFQHKHQIRSQRYLPARRPHRGGAQSQIHDLCKH